MSPNTSLERTTILIAAVLLLASTAASAETPWEAYLRAPSPAAAAAVQTAAYSKPVEINERFEADLSVLENEVAAGDAESTKLTVRLMTQFRLSAAIAEFLDAILGRSIRPNPVAFLQATSGVAGCSYATPRGDFFVDRREASVAEARARANALRGVINPELQKKRDECIALLERAD